MSKVKICPVCGKKNPVDNFECECGGDLLAIAPEEDVADQPAPAPAPGGNSDADPSVTAVDRRRALRLEASDGAGGFSVEDGAVVGREAVGKEFLSSHQTVSRRHARITHDGSRWQIEDLDSTNGTWVNERQIEPRTPCSIKPGDTVALSRGCVFKVKG